MPKEPHEESRQFLQCSWPEEFKKRRRFNRECENESYIEWLQAEFGDNSEEDEDEDNISSEYGDYPNGSDSEVEGYREKSESQGPPDGAWNDGDAETSNRYHNVRLFMAGMVGEEKSLSYCDQVEKVARFCEQESLEFGTKPDLASKDVALLDDRNFGSVDNRTGNCRPYLGPLNPQQLQQELSREASPTFILVSELWMN